MWVIFILSFEGECCTFKTQGKFAFLAYKHTIATLLLRPITSTALFSGTNSMKEGVLVNFMFNGFWNGTTSNVKAVGAVLDTRISEAMAKTTTSIAIDEVINVIFPSLCREGKRM